ncbi:luciferase-like monooxygenase [Labedaea rhizosphaerae]|uniref:Luciferase-like monooxygenase n=1 Tax=Labedaea rhizosphaerae TaxID=598644 RepID=A0A4R6SD59_LABRH|nr:luciferase-like monooxygenase [Labedaea rhizosphaerae]
MPLAVQHPAPATPGGPPILLGGGAEAALRRAGRLADGWISASRADLTVMGTAIRTIKAAAEEAGRDADALRFVCRGAVRVRPEGERDRMLSGTLEQIRVDMAELEQQGVTEFFVDLNFDERIGSPDADPAESLAKADEALEAFKP